MHQAQLTFNSGELSPYLIYRTDVSKHGGGAATMRNFLPLPYGAVSKRPGTSHVANLGTATENFQAFTFTASDGIQYLLWFTPGTLKVFAKDGTLKATVPFLAESPAPPSVSYNLRDMQMAQINDVAILTHPAFHPMRLSTSSDTEWKLEFLPFERAPMLDENLDQTKNLLVLSDPKPNEWVTATTYASGANVRTTSGQFICIQGHTSGASTTPGTGADWRKYWRRRVIRTGEAVSIVNSNPTWQEYWLNWTAGVTIGPMGNDAAYGTISQDNHLAGYYIHTSFVGSAAMLTESGKQGRVERWNGSAWVASSGTALMRPIYHGFQGNSVWTNTSYPQLSYVYNPNTGGVYMVKQISWWQAHVNYQPGVTANWSLWWAYVGQFNGSVFSPEWDSFVVGDFTYYNGQAYRCILNHVPDLATNAPGSGSSWATCWELISTYLTGYDSPIFSPGTYYRISPERDASDYQIEIQATSANNGVYSEIITVEGAWNVFSYGTADGTYILERSADFGTTWEQFRSYDIKSDRNITDTGTEDTPVWIRIKWIHRTAPSSATTPRMILVPEKSYVTGYALLSQFKTADGADAWAGEMKGIAVSPILSGRAWRWSEGAFSSRRGYPQAVASIDGRLAFAGTKGNPVSLWFSKVEDFLDFDLGTDDDAGIFATLATGTHQPIRWAMGARRLFLGTALGEWMVGSETDDRPMTPGNFQAREYTSAGSKQHQPIKLGDGLVFLGRKGTRVFELGGTDQIDTQDLTRLADHLTASGVVSIAFQQTREPCIWCVTTSGKLLSFHYSKPDQIAAWAQHDTQNGAFRAVLVFPSDSGDDEVFFIVERSGDLLLEKFPQGWQATQESGTIGRCVDGEDDEPITAELQFLPVDITLKDSGTTHGRIKRAHEVLVGTYQSYGGAVQYDGTTVPLESLNTSDLMSPTPALKSGWFSATLAPAHVEDLQPTIVHSEPYPFTVRAVVLRWSVREP